MKEGAVDMTMRQEVYEKIRPENIFEGCAAVHSLSIIWYVIRKQESEAKAGAWLNAVRNMLTVAGASQEQIKEVINNLDFHDFEDCLQNECAVHANAEYIVTCNIKDFQHAKTTVVAPDVFVKIVAAGKKYE